MSDGPTGGAATDPPAFQWLNEVGIIDELAQHRVEQLLAPDLKMSQFIVLNHLVRLGSAAALVDPAHPSRKW
jgi:hypothetical protein